MSIEVTGTQFPSVPSGHSLTSNHLNPFPKARNEVSMTFSKILANTSPPPLVHSLTLQKCEEPK